MPVANNKENAGSSSKENAVKPTELVERGLEKLERLGKQYTLGHAEKDRRMKKLIAQVCKRVDALEDKGPEAKARAAWWKGQAHGTLPEYSKEAEAFLRDAVKLAPGLVEAWNCLGTEYWKKKDLRAAADCFRGALKERKNKVSLRKLSMVVRNYGDEQTKRERLAESVSLAKQAIALDVKDGESWYVLGNAYMTSFFTTFATVDLESCLKAYETAERSSINPASSNPDLYYNRANVHKYYEQFQEAVDGYKKAQLLDPQLPGQDQVDNIHRFVKKLDKIISTKHGFKAKRLLKFAEFIPPKCEIRGSERKELDGLAQGENKGSFVVGVVISPITRLEDVPVSFIVMDKKTNMFVLSLYGVVSTLKNDIKIGDTLYINRPVLKRISVNEFKERSYPCITVSNPATLSINGNALPKKAFANPFVRVETFSTALTKEGRLSDSQKEQKS